MPQIIPIRDLKNTSEISQLCKEVNEPIFVTKNGYGDMVIMSIETYEKTIYMKDVYRKLEEAEESIKKGEVLDGFETIKTIKEKYGL